MRTCYSSSYQLLTVLCYRRVFLALALFNLERFDEAEENYKKAIEHAPSQALARQVR